MAIPSLIERFLTEAGFGYSTRRHCTAPTALIGAAATHVPAREWAKAVVFVADRTPILAVVPATCRVDPERLRALAGARQLRRAREAEIAALYPESECGAMPPLGPLYGHRVFLDQQLAREDHVWFNAGTHTDAIRMDFHDFAEAIHPIVGRIAAQS
ncbi:MAG TPA: YbaK/EbsC family protein [Vicinamibacterales bacterium]